MNGKSCSMSHRTAGTPHGPGMINGQQIPPIRVHAGTPCPSSNSNTPSPAIGNLSTSLHLKMPFGGGVAPQSNITDSTIHLPALSPRRQVVTNGKPLFQVPQPPGLPAPQSLKPKQQEFGNTFSPSTIKGGLGYGPRGKSIGKGSCNNLVVTSSPMMVQRLGPISPPANQVSTACNRISPSLQRAMNASNLNIPPSDTRSLMSRESLASATLSLSESQSALSVKHEWSHGYRILPSLPSNQGSQNGSELGDILSIPPGTSMSNNSVSNSLPSYLFGMENNHSPYPSPRHSSTRSHSARSKKRALSLSPLSDGIGIDFNTIIRTSPTSLVAYINGSRTSPANISPQPEVYGHFLGVRGSCIPQPCPLPNTQKGLLMANSNITLPGYSENGTVEYQRMQQLEQSSLQSAVMNNMVVQQGIPLIDSQPMGMLKSERVDDFSSSTIDMPPPPPLPPPPPQGPPPPYHAHQHRHQHDLINHSHQLALPSSAQGPLLDEDGELDDFNGKHCCRWIDCSALYDQQEELVRHIEKVHIDQRKGEDFTCFWAGCPRRYKPFNARYKLLIHMRVHSGEKPNKCTLRSSSELDQDILNDCLTIQPLQPAPSPHDAADNTMGRSPGPVHDIYTATMFSSTHSSRSGTAAGGGPPSHPVSHPSPAHNVHGSPCNPPSQLPLLSAVDSGTERFAAPAQSPHHISPRRIPVPPPMMQRRTPQTPHLLQTAGTHLKTYQPITNPSFQPNSIHIQGFYGQLQTFCPPHYTDTQRNIQHGGSCNMVPPFEDCLVPTSMSQAGFDVFHRAFSAHSGITVYDLPSGSTGIFGDSLRNGSEDASFLQINAVDRCPSQLSSVYTEG
ncbi:zinc finger protein GLIS3 isoform X2 [Gopherus flavomarginatus]|uniref:zinc finger protein GLIS3 isoform X2 n=1 Tax=Gopherus flavomarginatus TaxID=286002 RepID=UPI0021CBAB0B|nr:zinc finger protein GLIS3 isoform X2 [Gopherus flavomarginatus]